MGWLLEQREWRGSTLRAPSGPIPPGESAYSGSEMKMGNRSSFEKVGQGWWAKGLSNIDRGRLSHTCWTQDASGFKSQPTDWSRYQGEVWVVEVQRARKRSQRELDSLRNHGTCVHRAGKWFRGCQPPGRPRCSWKPLPFLGPERGPITSS